MLENAIGVVSAETLKSLSGLELLTGIFDGRYPRPPISALMDFKGETVEAGHAVFSGIPGPQHYNPIGTVHGGWIATILDSCMGCAVQSTLPKGTGYTTLEFKVNFTRPVTTETGEVRAEGRVLTAGRRTALAEGTLTDGKGRILAHATTTCLIMEL